MTPERAHADVHAASNRNTTPTTPEPSERLTGADARARQLHVVAELLREDEHWAQSARKRSTTAPSDDAAFSGRDPWAGAMGRKVAPRRYEGEADRELERRLQDLDAPPVLATTGDVQVEWLWPPAGATAASRLYLVTCEAPSQQGVCGKRTLRTRKPHAGKPRTCSDSCRTRVSYYKRKEQKASQTTLP